MKLVPAPGGRTYSFLPFKDTFFSASETPFFQGKRGTKLGVGVGLYQKGKDTFERLQMDAKDLFPRTDPPTKGDRASKLVRTTPYKNLVLFIGGQVHNDHQVKPFGAYAASVSGKKLKVKKIELPKDVIPWDIKTIPNRKVYLLTAKQTGDQQYVNSVWESATGNGGFKEILSFQATTFARSFEYLDDAFYFGMGTEVKDSGVFEGNSLKLTWDLKELSPECGEIYKLVYPPVKTANPPANPQAK